ncbi:sensor histidine kinase [Cyclobacterium plantarum]|uniref:histidine kinase n=1 Tax=Cyclobacterium plantarum TaxID=2716263 RepID=A0ABX0H8C2_9BACT|nr:HAMP domain-containing sensor histidine kinase [Cyclobacterium plantarum]NHE57625.1 HAMP domain-containing histidine kinase [Cyclobacterium plantarum]
MTISEAIRRHKDLILKRWKERLYEEIPEVKRHDKAAIENSVPDWLEALIDLLESTDNKEIVFNSQEHALDRSRFQIYSLKHIIREYNLLKHEIFNVTDGYDGVHPRDRNLIMYAIDLSIEEAAEAFYRIKQGVQVNARSVAEQKADAMQLQDDNREQFIRSITHDLNNPLINIKGCISLLEEGPDVNETAKILKMLKTCTEQAESLIKNFLDVSEVNPTEKLPVRKELVKIMEEIENEVAVYKLAYRNRIDIQCANSDLEAALDIGLFRRAFNNLMNNAIKHGANAPIEVHCSAKNDELAISVINQGRTIPAAEMEHIFNRYYKIEDGSRGWGIGLAFVKEVAHAHGGEVKVKSNEEEGTRFIFRIPINYLNN